MSCCFCIKCKSMVPRYEKYCDKCIRIFGVKQDEHWGKGPYVNDYEAQCQREFEKDLAESKEATL